MSRREATIAEATPSAVQKGKSRHQRRKAAKARNETKLARMIASAHSQRALNVVRDNLSQPFRGKFSPKGLESNLGRIASTNHYAYVCGERPRARPTG